MMSVVALVCYTHPQINILQSAQTPTRTRANTHTHTHKSTLQFSPSAGKYPTNLIPRSLLFFPTRWHMCVRVFVDVSVSVWISMNIFVRVKCVHFQWVPVCSWLFHCHLFHRTQCYTESFSGTIQYVFAAHAFALPTQNGPRTTEISSEMKEKNMKMKHTESI